MKCFHSFRLDTLNHCLWHEDERVAIPPKEYDLLRFLVENPGRLVTRDELLKAVWRDTFVNPEILRKYIQDIRRVLGDRPDQPIFIETIPKRGYRFVAPIVDEGACEVSVVLSPPSKAGATDAKKDAGEVAEEIVDSKSPLQSSRKRTYKLAVLSLLVATLAVGAAGYLGFLRTGARASVPKDTSIAVLPFVDLSPAHDQEYFSDGLSAELIQELAKVPGIKVVARSSSFQFKGKNEDLRIVGKRLGVANVLEGSLRREGNRIRITAELVEADNGFQVWSGSYDREISHITTTQDEIAGAVSGALQSRLLTPNSAAIVGMSPQTNPAAYQAYLEAQYFIARGQDKEDLNKALSYADQVIELDAGYAPAWAQRSLILVKLAGTGLIENTDGFRSGRESAEKAIALDPGWAAGYLALALVQIDYDWNWEGAALSLRKASQLEPGSAAVLSMQARLARMQGDLEQAVGLYRQAIALDPMRANLRLGLGDKLFDLGRYEEAKAELDKAQELNPQISGLHLTRGTILFSEGHQEEALKEIEEENGEWEKLSGEALAYFALGRMKDSDKALNKLIATHQNDAAFQIAEAYAYRGETDQAFQWLDRALRHRDPGMPEMKRDPLMKSLRSDPRYTEFLSKMHLRKY